MTLPDRDGFERLARRGNAVVLSRRLMSDQLTPVLAYRRLVLPDERTAPSFLFESVENGRTVGRHSLLGAQPAVEVVARGHEVTVIDHRSGRTRTTREPDPLIVPRQITAPWRLAGPVGPDARTVMPRFVGGWVGYAGYDTVRYLEPEKLPFDAAPDDDRSLPDLHLGLYRQVAVFDHVDKCVHALCVVMLDEHDTVEQARAAGCRELESFVERLRRPGPVLAAGEIDLDLGRVPSPPARSTMSESGFRQAVERAREYIAAGDAFQIVLSQRLERRTAADPFDIYRALRIVNPSPYMIYLQAAGSILVASSPEILCRVQDHQVTSRPLAGTRPRGESPEDDEQLERQLLGDEKERAEHVMLVDLARNDLGRVCDVGSIALPAVLQVERYSHVMHLSSTVTGRLRVSLDGWDALRASLPVGTVSGAPKVRAMQIIDELEPTRRGPYAGGIGMVSLNGDMDIALALRTMVVPTAARQDGAWSVHLQAGAGIVCDSDPESERRETLSKAAGLGRAIDLAEMVFGEESDEATERPSD